jgi:hypothetical protein
MTFFLRAFGHVFERLSGRQQNFKFFSRSKIPESDLDFLQTSWDNDLL